MGKTYNYLYGLGGLCLLLVCAEQYGEHRVNVKWDIERARMAAVAEQAESINKAANIAIAAQHKKDIENAKSKAGRTAVAVWLKSHGLLPDGTPVPDTAGSQTNSTCKPDATTGEPGASEHIAQFAEGCALDALKVLNWQEWALREGLVK